LRAEAVREVYMDEKWKYILILFLQRVIQRKI
jgi:hypothetical protein